MEATVFSQEKLHPMSW